MELIKTEEIPNWSDRREHNCPICLSTGPITLIHRVYEDFYRDFYYYEARFTCPECGFTVKSSGNSVCGIDAINELINRMNKFFYSRKEK